MNLTDDDLRGFILSGQWRCTPKELEAAVARLLAEKKALVEDEPICADCTLPMLCPVCDSAEASELRRDEIGRRGLSQKGIGAEPEIDAGKAGGQLPPPH
jgi:hypothetical protein